MEPAKHKKVLLILAASTAVAAAVQTIGAYRPRPGGAYPAYSQETTRPRTVAGPGAETQTPGVLDEALKRLTVEEQGALNRPDDPHGRIKTYVRLARARLKIARELLSREEYIATDEHLEVYAALIADAGRFLATSVPPRDRANKMLEQSLREQIRVLEGIRRDVTATHLEPIEKALDAANRVRRQSINALLGDGKILLGDPEQDHSKKAPQGQPK